MDPCLSVFDGKQKCVLCFGRLVRFGKGGMNKWALPPLAAYKVDFLTQGITVERAPHLWQTTSAKQGTGPRIRRWCPSSSVRPPARHSCSLVIKWRAPIQPFCCDAVLIHGSFLCNFWKQTDDRAVLPRRPVHRPCPGCRDIHGGHSSHPTTIECWALKVP